MAETLHFSTHANISSGSMPLVMIHGWGLNSGVWQPFIEKLTVEFSESFHVITVDLPGFGENHNKTITPYSLTSIVKELDKVFEKPAIYLGWSLGGLVATEMALAYPDKVLGLVTVASSPRFLEEPTTKNASADIWPGIKPEVLKAFHQQLQIDTQKTINNFLKIQAMGSPHIRHDIKQISQLVMQHQLPNKATLDESLSLLESSDYRDKLIEVKQPFLRLYGSADNLVPNSVIKQVADLSPSSEQHVFEKASHAPFISHLDDFNKVLTTWLVEQFGADS
jgi:pimeloyl-[acyl-carrier protein] methyl ester esterase